MAILINHTRVDGFVQNTPDPQVSHPGDALPAGTGRRVARKRRPRTLHVLAKCLFVVGRVGARIRAPDERDFRGMICPGPREELGVGERGVEVVAPCRETGGAGVVGQVARRAGEDEVGRDCRELLCRRERVRCQNVLDQRGLVAKHGREVRSCVALADGEDCAFVAVGACQDRNRGDALVHPCFFGVAE